MNFTILEFVVQETFVNMIRNKLMTLAAVVTMALTLAILGVFGVMSWKLERAVNDLPNKFEMKVYFKDQTAADREKVVVQKISQSPHVAKVTFTSKADAWKNAKTSLDKKITNEVNVNPMTDELNIRLNDAAMTENVAKWLMSLPEIDAVNDSRTEVNLLLKIQMAIRLAGAILTLVLLIASVVIIHNTIRLTISSRKDDIHVMQLIGAAPTTIRTPLVCEGMLQGVFGALVACGLIWCVMTGVTKYVTSLLPIAMTDYALPLGHIAVILSVIGILIGGVVSSVSLRRYLKEG